MVPTWLPSSDHSSHRNTRVAPGKADGGLYEALDPNQMRVTSGMATRRPIDVISRASGGAERRCRKRSRSSRSPRRGATTRTATANARGMGQS
jgi:hypothetical protein